MRPVRETDLERHGGPQQWDADSHFRCHLGIERRTAVHRYRVPDRAGPFPNGLTGGASYPIAMLDSNLRILPAVVLMDDAHETNY